MGGFEDLAGDTVSVEDLASGKVEVGADGKLAESEGSAPQAELFDSGLIEEKLREQLAGQVSEEPEGTPEEGESEGESEEHEEGESEETPEEQPKPKSQKGKKGKKDFQARVSELVAQRKEAEAKVLAIQEQNLQLQAQIAKQNQALQDKLVDLEQRRLEMAREDKSKAELAGMTPEERRVYEFKQQLKAEAKAELNAENAALRQELQELQKWRKGAEEYASKASREREVTQAVDQSLNAVMFRGMPAEEAEALRPVTRELVALFSAAYGDTPERIAPQLKDYLDKWTKARTAQIARSGKDKLGKSGKVPAPPMTGKASTQVEDTKTLSLAELGKLGYKSHARYYVDKALGRVKR